MLIAISEQIRTEIQQHNVGRLFAVVHLNGTQRKITAEDIIVLHKHISADIGEKIILNKVRNLDIFSNRPSKLAINVTMRQMVLLKTMDGIFVTIVNN